MIRLLSICLLFIFICTSNLFAQAGYSVGVAGSYDFTSLFNKSPKASFKTNSDKLSAYNRNAGVSFGCNYLRIRNFENRIGVTADLLVKSHVVNFGFNSDDINWTQTIKLYYTDFNCLLKYKTSWGMFIESGPQFSFLNNANEEVYKTNIASTGNNPDIQSNITDNYTNFNVLVIAGIGGEFKIVDFVKNRYKLNLIQVSNSLSEKYQESLYFIFGARFAYGFYDMLNSHGRVNDRLHTYYYYTTYNETKIATLGINAGISYRFN